MAFDQGLAQRIREALPEHRTATEKQMFGGLCFMSHGNMFLGIVKEELMVRVGPTRHAEALARPHARPMDFAGRPMVGYVFVGPAGYAEDAALGFWVGWALEHVDSLPQKSPKVGINGRMKR